MERVVGRWRDKAELIVSAIVICTALYGWLRAEWVVGTRLDAVERSLTKDDPTLIDHEHRLTVVESKIDYIVKGIDEIRRK